MNVSTKRLNDLGPWGRTLGNPLLGIAVLLLTALPTCVLDSAFGTLAGDDHEVPPPAPPTFVDGQALSGSSIRVFGPTRNARPGLATEAGDDGSFTIEVPHTDAMDNATIVATSGGVVLMAIVPTIPAVDSVYDDPPVVDLATDVPDMDPLDSASTTISLLIEGGQRNNGGNLGGINSESVRQSITDVAAALDNGEEVVVTFFDMVDRLITAAEGASTPVFLTPDAAAEAGSSLNQAFLDAVEVDYDGDDTPDTDTVAFETALAAATEGVGPEICLDPDTIRVVFQVNFNPPLFDGTCSERDPEKWLDCELGTQGCEGRNMYITGGVNEYQVRCEDDPDFEFCATQAEVEMVNNLMHGDPAAGWIPNVTLMYDDGTNGDAAAGDGIYTRVFDLPRGIRVGYKYTWGDPGVGWTGTEEWPGNGRLLEAIDVNGDGIVVRRDQWGDEASNKDRQNLLPPVRGGRGNVVWSCQGAGTLASPEGPQFCSADDNGEGVTGVVDANRETEVELFPDVCPCFDFREIPVNLDGDSGCVPDGFPSPGPVTPITVPCP